MASIKFFKVFSKMILSSNKEPYVAVRWIVSYIFFSLAVILRKVNSSTANFFYIYACVLAFDPDRLAAKIDLYDAKSDPQLVIACRAFFEIAFARGELLEIVNLLQKIIKFHPYLFVPWKLLHYSYYFTKSWDLLIEVNASYEIYRMSLLEYSNIVGYDIIFGDHVTASIGHSQIFFDFEILHSLGLKTRPKIAVCKSTQDKMSGFYRELLPDVINATIPIDPKTGQRSDLVNFLQDSFPFMVAKKYFGYQEERGRAKYLTSWAATGASAFALSGNQRAELDLFLRSLELTDDDWYVVLHVREGADNSIRNADINTYHGAIDAILSKGGWVFRIGDASMTPLHNDMKRVVDLPFRDIFKPPYIDLYLLGTARFVICTASGPSDFPFYFNVPRLITNWPVMYALFGSSNDICLPVSYYCTSRDLVVPLREQLNSVVYESNSTLQSLKSVMSIKNSSKQIELATNQMLGHLTQRTPKMNFPIAISDSLMHRYEDKFWFMGSISNSFLEDNPSYLD